MKIIVGLGNPGRRYRNTRHNVGFMALDSLAARLNAEFSREKYQALVAEVSRKGERLLLLKPLTSMNNSGSSVARATRNTMKDLAGLLVVADDVCLPVGKLRLRRGGSAGGHNGLKSVIDRLGTEDFPRLRMGVGENVAEDELAEYVLGKFTPDEGPAVNEMVARAVEAILWWQAAGMDAAMNEFN